MKLDKQYIIDKVTNILNKEHKINQKKEIKYFDDRIAVSCPYCGDSQKFINKKRGTIYWKNLFYICYNCNIKKPITSFFNDFNEKIDIDKKIELYNYIDENTKFTLANDQHISTELDKLIDFDTLIEFFNTKKNSWLYNLKPVEFNSRVYNYLRNTRLVQDFSQMYQGIYRVIKNDKVVFFTDVIVTFNMSLSEKKVIGMQLRNLESSKEKRFYKIIDFEQIYNYMNPSDILDDIEAISYNKLSHFYNILNIDFNYPITIFEGYIDSTFEINENNFNNSIGLIGLNSSKDILGFLLDNDENLDLRFFYDNDVSGILKSTEMLKKGYKVFLWNKLFDTLLKKSKDKQNASKLKNIIDLNDLVMESKNPNIYSKLKLYNFFSNDKFDMLYMSKLIKKDGKWEISKY